MILAYKQMGWFAPAHHMNLLEHDWIVWDRLLLDTLGGRALLESLGPVLPSILELSYSLVYTIPPLTMAILYGLKLRHRSDALLTIYLLGLLICYAQFPFWPSEPPRAVFPGQDMPTVHTPFRDFNLWLVGNYGIHTSVFPSAHVSGVFAAAMAMLYLVPQRRRLLLAYFTYASLVAIITVYGRYHYAVDAVGGLVIGVAAGPLGARLMNWFDRHQTTKAKVGQVGNLRPIVNLPGSAKQLCVELTADR
jgi:membrane-associated phospholipid phosphatase